MHVAILVVCNQRLHHTNDRAVITNERGKSSFAKENVVDCLLIHTNYLGRIGRYQKSPTG